MEGGAPAALLNALFGITADSALRIEAGSSCAGKRGWGLRCARDLRQGEFVCEYAGEVITTTEAVRALLPEA